MKILRGVLTIMKEKKVTPNMYMLMGESIWEGNILVKQFMMESQQ